MAGAILVSTFGCVNGMLLAGARVYYAMSQDGLFFKAVGRLSERSKTPVNSLWVQCVWTCLLCQSGSYGQLLDYVIFAVLIFYVLTIAGFVCSAQDAARCGEALQGDRIPGAAGPVYRDGFMDLWGTIAVQTAVHVAGIDSCAAWGSGVSALVAQGTGCCWRMMCGWGEPQVLRLHCSPLRMTRY